MAEEEDTALADARKLPLADRVCHKNWKVRGEAYDSIATACERAFNSDEVAEYGVAYYAKASQLNARALLGTILSYTFGVHSLTGGAGAVQALIWPRHRQIATLPLWTRR